ncbi:MAG: hypothetical protein CME88_04040 [Hirschia sp.]|nr:hypothetical protein [Hirschia sp.]MBF17529.1 hypothetical protein [Hirschia sp.]
MAIVTRCEQDGEDVLTPFLTELARIVPESAPAIDHLTYVILEEARTEEPEYVCTPEMFEISAQNASLALESWAQARQPTSGKAP